MKNLEGFGVKQLKTNELQVVEGGHTMNKIASLNVWCVYCWIDFLN